MSTSPRDERLDSLLQDLGPADPPSDFAAEVLSKIEHAQIERTHVQVSSNVVPFRSGGFAMTMTKKAMWGLAAAATIILAVFVARGFPIVDRGTEGAIGAAKKYQAPQLTNSDVVVGDAAAQEFLQSETFDRLIKDPQAVSLLSNADLRAALGRQGFADALRDVKIRQSLRDGLLSRIFSDAAVRAQLDDALKSNMSKTAVRQANADASLRSMHADLLRAMQDANLKAALANDAFRNSLDDANLRALLTRQDIAAALDNSQFIRALNQRGFTAALRTARMKSLMRW